MPYVFNCAKGGASCADPGAPANGYLGCYVTACSDTDNQYHCSGSIQYVCHGTYGFGEDCALSQATCRAGTCLYNAPPCASAGSSCTGDTVTLCTANGQRVTEDCTLAGLRCVQDPGGPAYCVAPGCTVSDAKACRSSCAGDGRTANVCVGGAVYSIDCTKYGFTRCDVRSGSVQCLP